MKPELIKIQKSLLETILASGKFSEEYVSISSANIYGHFASVTIRIDFPDSGQKP